jgi:hypothetical protein
VRRSPGRSRGRQTNTRPRLSRSRIELIAWRSWRKQGQRSSSALAQPTAHCPALIRRAVWLHRRSHGSRGVSGFVRTSRPRDVTHLADIASPRPGRVVLWWLSSAQHRRLRTASVKERGLSRAVRARAVGNVSVARGRFRCFGVSHQGVVLGDGSIARHLSALFGRMVRSGHDPQGPALLVGLGFGQGFIASSTSFSLLCCCHHRRYCPRRRPSRWARAREATRVFR